MSGAHCPRFPECMKVSDQPRLPSCDKQNCPGNAGFLPMKASQRLENLKAAFAENDIPFPSVDSGVLEGGRGGDGIHPNEPGLPKLNVPVNFPYFATFRAIAFAVEVGAAKMLHISVEKFQQEFNRQFALAPGETPAALPVVDARNEGIEEARAHNEKIVQLLTDVFALLPPSPMKGPDGKVYEYHDPKAAETLLLLRKRLDEGLAALKSPAEEDTK